MSRFRKVEAERLARRVDRLADMMGIATELPEMLKEDPR